MRRILILIIICLLIPNISFNAQATEGDQDTSSTSETKPSKTKEEQEDNLDFSDTGRPGQQTAGESRGSCGDLGTSFTAVIPASYTGKTVMGRPNFWVYFPAVSKKISHLEFILQNEAREDIWRSSTKANFNAGYQNFALPSAQPPLKIGQWYRWYVKAYCRSQVASSSYVQGWIQRIPVTSQLYLDLQADRARVHFVYGNHGIWYDAVDRLLRLDQHQLNSLAAEQDWRNVMEAGGLCLKQLPHAAGVHEAISY